MQYFCWVTVCQRKKEDLENQINRFFFIPSDFITFYIYIYIYIYTHTHTHEWMRISDAKDKKVSPYSWPSAK